MKFLTMARAGEMNRWSSFRKSLVPIFLFASERASQASGLCDFLLFQGFKERNREREKKPLVSPFICIFTFLIYI